MPGKKPGGIMKTPDFPAAEQLRQAALDNSGLLDSGAEERFDRLTRMACSIFNVPIALVSLIDGNRQWFKSCQGLPVSETPRDISFCGHAILHSDTLVIEDTLNDERFSDNPLVTDAPFIRFYAGAPLHNNDGYRLGTLCLIDRQPRTFSERDQNLLRDLADCVEREANLQAASALNMQIKQQNDALSALNSLALDPETNDDERIRKALRLGCDYLDMPQAIVSEITGDVYSILWFAAPDDSGLEAGLSFPLADTYCAITINQQKSLAIAHMAYSPYKGYPCYDQFGLESYLAAPIRVQNRLFGTLNFSSFSPRVNGFSDTEITFVTLLARLIAGVIERQISVRTLTKLVEQTPGMLYQFRQWPDGTTAFPFASPGIRDIYGVSPEVAATDAQQMLARMHPDDIEGIRASIARSAKQLTDWQHQYRVMNGNGQWRWVEGRSTPERLADNSTLWHGYITDIHDKKQAQITLQQSEKQLRNLFELSPIGIGLSDLRSARLLEVNEALRKPTGYTYEELTSIDFGHLLPGGLREFRTRVMAELSEAGRYGPFEQEVIRRDGSSYHVVMQGLRIAGADGQPLLWSLVEDISERKKIEQMKNEFISTVSHELRTPLTSILGSLGLAASGTLGNLPKEAGRMIDIATRNSLQLKLLIDDLLDMEKLVTGKMPIHLQPEPVSDAVQETVDQLRTYAVDRGITIRFIDHTQGELAMIDRRRFGQALCNLLSNAIKFSPADSEVLVTSSNTDNWLHIQVSDQGVGIPDSFRARIFQKFAQADSSDTRGRGGTGLGLAITRELMAQMNGQVGFESEEGKGSTFWLEVAKA